MEKLEKLIKYNAILLLVLSLSAFTNGGKIVLIVVSISLLLVSVRAKAFFFLKGLMYSSLIFSALITFLILFSVLFETLHFFYMVPVTDFFFGLKWHPFPTIKDGKIVSLFGIVPLITGTFMITIIAMLVAAPIGLFAAIFLANFASHKMRNFIKPVVGLLSGIPTVVYGYLALNSIGPFIQSIVTYMGYSITSENALTAGIVIGIMIMPLIITLVDDILLSVPKNLYYGSLALGSTSTEALLKIMLPYSLPGIISSVLLAVSRALGETMIVLMVTGVSSNLSFNPLASTTTVTVQISTMLTGDQTFSSVETISAYALACTLFIITWILNALALTVVNRYKR